MICVGNEINPSLNGEDISPDEMLVDKQGMEKMYASNMDYLLGHFQIDLVNVRVGKR